MVDKETELPDLIRRQPNEELALYVDGYRAPPEALDKVDVSHLTNEQNQQFHGLMEEFADVFAADKSALGLTSETVHSIKLTDETPIKQRPRQVSPPKRPHLDAEVQRMKDLGIIVESNSPWASPVVLIPKGNGEWCFCVDYRELNDRTVKDSYPLPRIDDLLDVMKGARYFSCLDLQSGFWQVKMDPADQAKTAFTIPDGLYEFTVMPFGLTNAPSTFQRLMTNVLQGLLYKNVVVFIDDICVFSATWEEHLQHLREVFTRLRKAGLRLNVLKSHFAKAEQTFLGFVVSSEGVKTDPKKVEAMAKFPVPKNITELCSFLGTTGFYRRFISNYASKTNALSRLTRKENPFEWTPQCQYEFDELKKYMTEAPVLAYPNFKEIFFLHTDASVAGLGVILGQYDENKKERVIAYASRKCDDHEMNYSPTELEALAVLWGVDYFEHYLKGSKFEIHTDHEPLLALLKTPKKNRKYYRYAYRLMEHNFVIKHCKGEKNRVDSLSRSPVGQPDGRPHLALFGHALDYPTYKELLENSPEVWGPHPAQPPDESSPAPEYTIRLGNLYKETKDGPKRVIRSSEVLDVLYSCHHGISGTHFRIGATSQKIKDRFWWPKMDQDISSFVKACDDCQRKEPKEHTHELYPIPADGPFERWGIDYVGALPLTERGNTHILVAVDYFTKWPIAVAVPEQTGDITVQFIINHIISQFGCPKKIQTDNATQFRNQWVRELKDQWGIDHILVTPYHPQGNGLVERFNGTLCRNLAKYAYRNKETWDRYLPWVLLSYWVLRQHSSRFSPFQLVYGLPGRLPVDLEWELPGPADNPRNIEERIGQILRWLEPNRLQTTENIKQAQERQKRHHDDHITPRPFEIGDKVLVRRSKLETSHSAKFDSMWDGPFYIHQVHRHGTYTLRPLDEWNPISGRFHGDRLKLYKELPSQPIVLAEAPLPHE